MKRTFLISLVLLTSLILTGCFSTNEELSPGVDLYEQGTEESLVDARVFFMEYLIENPDDGEAKDYITKIDEKYIEVGKNAVDKYFSEGNIIRAYEVMKNLSVLAPGDIAIQDAFAEIEILHKEQIEFNEFTNYLEDVFKISFETYSFWDEISSDGILGKITTAQLIEHSKTTLSQISDIRKRVEDEALQMTNSTYIEINSNLFAYLYSVENSFSRIATGSPDMMRPFDVRDRTSVFNPENFNRTFSQIKSLTDRYAMELDSEGVRVRNIENTLFFNYDDIVRRQKEETMNFEEINKTASDADEDVTDSDEE